MLHIPDCFITAHLFFLHINNNQASKTKRKKTNVRMIIITASLDTAVLK